MPTPTLTPLRPLRHTEAAVVFVHGYTGNPLGTWKLFAPLLLEQPALREWDAYSIGYQTRWIPDVLARLWAADAPLKTLASLLNTLLNTPPLSDYKSLSILAHSMGGLVVQRALLDGPAAQPVSHVLLFGTPSNGLEKASWIRFWKRQFRDMDNDGPFITTLRQDWKARFEPTKPFSMLVVQGENDEFVPSDSSLGPFGFDPSFCRTVPGDHVTMLEPLPPRGEVAIRLAVDFLTRGSHIGLLALDAAKVAVESRDFQKAVHLFADHADQLDDSAAVQYALALDATGRGDEAVKVLMNRLNKSGTDVMGTLAGRIKRRWKRERRADDAQRALELYREAYTLASQQGNDAQAYYHAINVAFMTLAALNQPAEARRWADIALGHCANADEDAWNLATQAEARLVKGDIEAALSLYGRAIAQQPALGPRELASMYEQAVYVAQLLRKKEFERQLADLFSNQKKN